MCKAFYINRGGLTNYEVVFQKYFINSIIDYQEHLRNNIIWILNKQKVHRCVLCHLVFKLHPKFCVYSLEASGIQLFEQHHAAGPPAPPHPFHPACMLRSSFQRSATFQLQMSLEDPDKKKTYHHGNLRENGGLHSPLIRDPGYFLGGPTWHWEEVPLDSHDIKDILDI